MNRQTSTCTHRLALQGNNSLWLTDPQQGWTVQTGSLAVFTVPYSGGIAAGERRYLFTATPGQPLFGIAPSGNATLALVAIALEPTELSGVTLPHPTFAPQVAGWLTQLGNVEGWPTPPLTGQDLAGQQPFTHYIALVQGQRYRPPAQPVTWVQIQDGRALWLGRSDLVLDRESGIVPLTSQMWLEVGDRLELRQFSGVDGLDATQLLRGLSQLHAHLLTYLAWLADQDNQTARLRFEERQQLNQQVTQDTIHQLVAVLQTQPRQERQAHTPLLIAAGAIARAMGVTIHPPRKSENPHRVKDPLEAIARASQLRLRRVLLRDRWWQKDSGPMLAYTRMDRHPVALLPWAAGGYEMLDPTQAELNPSPRPTRVNGAIAATLEPIAYMFYRPLPAGMLTAPALLQFALKGRHRDVLRLLWTGMAAALLGMLVPQATAALVDQAIPGANLALVQSIGLGLLAAALGGATFQLVQAIAALRLETLSDATLQAAVWDRLLQLKPSFFRQYAIGDLNSRVSGISVIRRKLSGTTLQTLFTGTFSLLNLGLLFYYSPSLAMLALGLALVLVGFTVLSGMGLLRQHHHLMEIEGHLSGIVVQLINGVSKLRIAGAEQRAFAYWGQYYTRQLHLTLRAQRLEDWVDLLTTLMPPLTAAVIFWLASSQVIATDREAGLSVGTFLAFNVAFGTFIAGMTNLSLTLTELLDVVPLWQRSQPILVAEPETTLDKADPGQLSGRLEMNRVTFRYREDGPLILNEVSIQAQPGEFIALVGPSGSGKSTILRLVLGFEPPLSGAIYYDGQDLAGLDVSAVRRQLGVVLQHGRINAGSIVENIAGGALITLDEAWAAAEHSGLADDIRAMPMQMHTVISEGGTNLSGGQRQRLVIARALALQPRILLLDEATSALDNRTQAIVSQSLDRLNVTRVVIAHRLSTIRHADRIYVLDAGRVVQQGTFDQLAHQPGLFSQLIRRQMV